MNTIRTTTCLMADGCVCCRPPGPLGSYLSETKDEMEGLFWGISDQQPSDTCRVSWSRFIDQGRCKKERLAL